MKALVLETAMAARPPAEVSVYDVSSPEPSSSLSPLCTGSRGMSRHAHALRARARRPPTFEIRNCIPGNSLNLY